MKQRSDDHTSDESPEPLSLSVEVVKKMRPSYRPKEGKRVHGMRATGALMGCPGRSVCVYGKQCPVRFYSDPPERWIACALEAKRYDELRAGLVPWILEARKRPKIVDPSWMEEVARAYIEEQLLCERLQRYIEGSGLVQGLPGFDQDPVIVRHYRRVNGRRDELRFYLHDLVTVLRRARSEDRYKPFPRSRTRTAWFDLMPRSQRTAGRRNRRSKSKSGKRHQGRKKQRKLYRSHRVKTIMQRRRRGNAA